MLRKLKYSPVILVLLGTGGAVHAQTVCQPWSDEVTRCDLGTLKADNLGWSYARAVSADGSTVVGGADTDEFSRRAFVWRTGDLKMRDLGSLKADNLGWSTAYAVSADGSTVVGESESDDGYYRAFVWRTGDLKMRGLGTLKADNSGWSAAFAVSADGSTVVGDAETDDSNTRAFVWRIGDVKMRDLGSLRADNLGFSTTHAVSADGSTVVGESESDASNSRAFMWRTGDLKMRDLGTLKADNSGVSIAHAVSADGSMVVGQADTDDGYIRAFVWRTGDLKMRGLGTLKADNSGFSYANAVSADGSTVVGDADTDDFSRRAFVWRTGDVKMKDLGSLKADNLGFSSTRDVSADGSTVVGLAVADDGYNRAFMWRTGDLKMTDLGSLRADNSGWSIANAVNADGSTVVGEAETDDSSIRAFVWRRNQKDDGGGEIQDLNNLLGSYARLSDETEQALRTQHRAIAQSLEQTCFAGHGGGNCFRSTVMVSQAPSDGSSGSFGIGRSNLTTGTLSYGRGITDQFTFGASVTAYGGNLRHSGIDLGTGWGLGVFAQYSQEGKSRKGWQAGAGFQYSRQNMDISRGEGLANVQRGQGNEDLESLALRTGVGYGVELSDAWLLTPQAQLTYYHTRRGGYTEKGDGLVFDTQYDELKDNSTLLSLGADMQRFFGDRSRLLIGAGVDVDLSVKEARLTGTSNVFTLGDGMKRFAFTSDLDRNRARPYVQTSYSYDLLEDKGTIGVGARLSRPEYGSKGAEYTVGLSYVLNF